MLNGQLIPLYKYFGVSLVVCYPVSAYALFPGDLGKIDVEAQKRKMKPQSSLCFYFLSIYFILSWYLVAQILLRPPTA